MLHITNGESVVNSMREAQLPGEHLSWIDVLCDGPVPLQAPAELARTRANFIASLGWASYDDALRSLTDRDDKLNAHASDDEIVFWFEHDLFDQLQLIQILDRFAFGRFSATLSLICIDRFPGVDNFIGLGQLEPQQLVSLAPFRTPLALEQIDLGRDAWEAFCAPEPMTVQQLLNGNTSALPFLAAALHRWLQEFPSVRNGLSRTEEQILRAAASGACTRQDMYLESRKSEEAIFMGDASVFWRMDRLASSPLPALNRVDDQFELTGFGRSLLDGRSDWIRDRGGIDTWLGGTHLSGEDAGWRWDGTSIVSG